MLISYFNHVFLQVHTPRFFSLPYVYCQSTQFKWKRKAFPEWLSQYSDNGNKSLNILLLFQISSVESIFLWIYFPWSVECLQNIISLIVITILRHVGNSLLSEGWHYCYIALPSIAHGWKSSSFITFDALLILCRIFCCLHKSLILRTFWMIIGLIITYCKSHFFLPFFGEDSF